MAEADDELHNLRRWKAEATEVLNAWERVWEALGSPGGLGSSKAEASEREAHRLRLLATRTQTRHRPKPRH